MKTNPFRAGTRRWYIAEIFRANKTARECYSVYVSRVGAEKPFFFLANAGGKRVNTLPLQLQRKRLVYEINKVYGLMSDGKHEDLSDDIVSEDPEETQEPEITPEPEETQEPEETPEETPEPETVTPRASGKARKLDELEWFLTEVRRIRRFCDDRAGENDSTRVDTISLRPIVYGKAAIAEGIPAKALLYSMTIHWSKESRDDAGIEEFDFAHAADSVNEKHHSLVGYVLKLARARVPIWLTGPAGSGKSQIARHLAELLFPESQTDEGNFRYGETPLTAGAMPSWLIGSETVTGYKTRPFLEIYSGGGVFCFEEIDSADPNMLIVVNNALSAESFYNPANGERYVKHKDFIPVATANTYGLGANRFYTGRERLDFATLDRFRMGRVYVGVDETLESRIAGI